MLPGRARPAAAAPPTTCTASSLLPSPTIDAEATPPLLASPLATTSTNRRHGHGEHPHRRIVGQPPRLFTEVAKAPLILESQPHHVAIVATAARARPVPEHPHRPSISWPLSMRKKVATILSIEFVVALFYRNSVLNAENSKSNYGSPISHSSSGGLLVARTVLSDSTSVVSQSHTEARVDGSSKGSTKIAPVPQQWHFPMRLGPCPARLW